MDRDTWGNVFDEFTLRTVHKLSSDGHFEGLKSPIALGKEANVFSAEKNDSLVCVKIYRLEAADFKRMYTYIMGDPRFKGVHNQRRKVIFEWTKREFRNLVKARDGNCKVPKPLAFRNNILVMEWIGDKQPAPTLKNKPPQNPNACFDFVIDQMKKLINAGLVHGDLSEYNILNNDEEFLLIDLSHGTPVLAAVSRQLLERDIKNVFNYFKRMKVNFDEEKIREEIMQTFKKQMQSH